MNNAADITEGSLGGETAHAVSPPVASLRALVAQVVALAGASASGLTFSDDEIDHAVRTLGGDPAASRGSVAGGGPGVAAAPALEQLPDHARRAFVQDAAWALTDSDSSASAAARRRAALLAAGGDRSGAEAALLDAAQLAEDCGDVGAARSDIEGALACRAQSSTSSDEAELLERRARLAADAGHDDAEDCWRDVAALRSTQGDAEGEARALFYASWAAASPRDCTDLLDAAARLGAAHLGWAARAAAVRALHEGLCHASLPHDEVALRIARRSGDRQLEALAMLGIAVAHSLIGDLPAAIEAQRSAIAIARVAGNQDAEDSGRINLVSMLQDDLRDAEAEAEATLLTAIQSDRGRWSAAAEAQALLAQVKAHRGRLPEAVVDVEAARRRTEDAGCDPVSHANVLAFAARVHAEAGSPDEVLAPLLEELSQAAIRERNGWLQTSAGQAQATALEDAGDLAAACVLLIGLEVGDNGVTAAEVACSLSRMALATGDEEALAHAEGLLEGATVQARIFSAVRRQVACVREAVTTGDATIAGRAADEWLRRGRTLEGGRLLLAASEQCEGAAASQLAARAQTLLASAGAELARQRAALRAEQLLDSGHCGAALEPLMAIALFAGMDPAVRDELLAHAITVRRERGAILHDPDDDVRHLTIVRSGRVRLCRVTGDERRLTVELLDPGTPFGEHRLLGLPAPGTIAEAEEDVTLALLPIDRVVEAIGRSPHLGANLFALVGGRLERSRQLAERVAFWSVDRRLARCILELHERYGHPTLDGHQIIGRAFTHFQLADLVNARRETVGEFLKRLRAAGVIELRRRCIVILDHEALERIVREA